MSKKGKQFTKNHLKVHGSHPKKIEGAQVELKMSEELKSQLEAQLKDIRENPGTIKDIVSAALREMMIEENSGSELDFDEDATKLVDFIVQSLRNHAIKSAGKHILVLSASHGTSNEPIPARSNCI